MKCKTCDFDTSRPRGYIAATKGIVDMVFIDSVRCQKCNRVPDWILWQEKPKTARIIYRNFKGSKEYFSKLKNELRTKGYQIFGENK